MEHKLKEADANLLSRDRVIAELRLRLPATAERDEAITKATTGAQYQEEQYETKQALRVAQTTIGSLQVRETDFITRVLTLGILGNADSKRLGRLISAPPLNVILSCTTLYRKKSGISK